MSFALLVVPRAVSGADRRAELTRKALAAARAAALFLIVIVLPARLYLQLDAMRFPGEPIWQSVRPLMETQWSVAWTIQWFAVVLVAALVWPGLSPTLHESKRTIMLALCAVAVLIVAVGLALSSHAASVDSFRGVAIVADALHVLGVGTWLGTLGILASIVLRPPRESDDDAVSNEREALVRAFSPLALACVAIVASSGVLAAILHIRSIAELLGTAYGRTLLLKLLAVAIVLLMGYLNWKRNTDLIKADRGAGIRSGALRELGASLVALLITSALVATPPP